MESAVIPLEVPQAVESWFETRGYVPFAFQKSVWQEYNSGHSGMVYTATGSGKTYAALFGPIIEWLTNSNNTNANLIIWVTPLRALTNDIHSNLSEPIEELGLPWTVETRTGDTSSYTKRKQTTKLPTVLVTTPESLTTLLSYEKIGKQFEQTSLIVVDEWHELIGTKRGVQLELALARVKRLSKNLRVWGLSATLGNPQEALEVLMGKANEKGTLVTHDQSLNLDIASIIPDEIELFPWAGHIGSLLLPRVVQKINQNQSTLLFTNTRFQAEKWYQDILAYDEMLAGQIALHHGSLDQDKRQWVEKAIQQGRLKCVVATSSLDLGVDFSPVDHVIQLGSPKGISRFLQRAGRSGHKPGEVSSVTFVPTNCFELIELSAAREAIEKNILESRNPVVNPLDVLIQHLVTISIGPGFEESELLEEVRTTHSYRNLSQEEWSWVMDFVVRGGNSLSAYPEYQKITLTDGKYRVSSKPIATRHRMSIGTITSDSLMKVKYVRGPQVGIIEESFIAKLTPGDVFSFAGRSLELVRVRDMIAYVRKSKVKNARPVRWMGGKMPLSTELAKGVRKRLDQARKNKLIDSEMKSLKPILELQDNLSTLPKIDELLIEQIETGDGHHMFFFPFEGRMVHEGLSSIVAYRISQLIPITFTIAINDYGFELLSNEKVSLDNLDIDELFSSKKLDKDILSSLNTQEMARRHFREIARIAGLVFQGYLHKPKSTRQIQASSSLLFDVFQEYDPESLLLHQSKIDVLENQLEFQRLSNALDRIAKSKFVVKQLTCPSPLAFPLMVDRLREKVSSEKLEDRIRKMKRSLFSDYEERAKLFRRSSINAKQIKAKR